MNLGMLGNAPAQTDAVKNAVAELNQNNDQQKDTSPVYYKAGKELPKYGGTTEGYTPDNVLGNKNPITLSPPPNAIANMTPGTQNVKTGQIDNTTPNNYLNYLNNITGSKGGAITKMAAGVLGNLAAGVSRGVASATGGRYGNANAQFDNTELQNYNNLKHNQMNLQQGAADRANTLNQDNIVSNNDFVRSETSADNQMSRDERLLAINQNFQERMQDKGFRDSIDLLVQNFEHSKATLGLQETQQKAISQFLADLKAGDAVRAFNTFAKSGISENEMANFVARVEGGKRVFDDILGSFGAIGAIISSDTDVKTNIKPKEGWRPKPFWHKNEQKKVLTREDKIERLNKWSGRYGN